MFGAVIAYRAVDNILRGVCDAVRDFRIPKRVAYLEMKRDRPMTNPVIVQSPMLLTEEDEQVFQEAGVYQRLLEMFEDGKYVMGLPVEEES
jgi:hypothetical protein